MFSFRLIFQILIGSLLILAGLLGVSYMQHRFDASDEKKALQALSLKYPDLVSPEKCVAVMESRTRGTIRVTCGDRAWMVDVLAGAYSEIPQQGTP